jgi:hypothetical protein
MKYNYVGKHENINHNILQSPMLYVGISQL